MIYHETSLDAIDAEREGLLRDMANQDVAWRSRLMDLLQAVEGARRVLDSFASDEAEELDQAILRAREWLGLEV